MSTVERPAVYNVRVSDGLFEALTDRVEWGEPDEDGFYTPTLYRGKVTDALEFGLAWQEAEAALPDGWLMWRVQNVGFGRWSASAWNHDTLTVTDSTPAASLRALAEKLREVKQ